MGKILNGILGGVSGKVGNVIGATWNGIDYIRVYPASVANPQTDAQLVQRQKLTVINATLKPMLMAIRIGFAFLAVKMSAWNAAFSYNILNAVTGTYPSQTANYTNIKVSIGELPAPLNQVASSTVAATVKVDWEDNSDEVGAAATDKTCIVVLNPLQHQAIVINGLSTRTDGTQTVSVPDSFTSDLVETYIFFKKADGSAVSDSQFAGAVTVA